MSITHWMAAVACAFLVLAFAPVNVAFADEAADLAAGASTGLADSPGTSEGGGLEAGQGAAELDPGLEVKEPANKARIAEGAYAISSKLSPSLALDLSGKAEKGVQAAVKKRAEGASRLFYIRPEGENRYSIQVVSTGLFVTESNGKAVLRPWAGSDGQLWWAASNSGVTFVNASSGQALAVEGGKAKSGAKIMSAPLP